MITCFTQRETSQEGAAVSRGTQPRGHVRSVPTQTLRVRTSRREMPPCSGEGWAAGSEGPPHRLPAAGAVSMLLCPKPVWRVLGTMSCERRRSREPNGKRAGGPGVSVGLSGHPAAVGRPCARPKPTCQEAQHLPRPAACRRHISVVSPALGPGDSFDESWVRAPSAFAAAAVGPEAEAPAVFPAWPFSAL